MCLYPRLIENPKYKRNKKNGGIIPPFSDNRVLIVPIGCGNCMECRKQKAREWQVRLLEDIKTNTNGKFVTLTFSNESIAQINSKIPTLYKNRKGKVLPLEGYIRDNQIATYAVRHFLERWRKKFKKSVRHWLVTELGHNGTENIHLHGIIYTNESFETIRNRWAYGYIYPRPGEEHKNFINSRSINYMVKYVHKMDKDHPNYKSIVLSSAGIGKNYTEKNLDSNTNKFNGTETIETYRTPSGHKIALPIYWRNKIYTEEEREQLWLNKLDKNERWVGGERIDMTQENSIENYYKMLEWYKKINRKLGYGNSFKNWNQIEYENQRRKLLLGKRTENIEIKTNSNEINKVWKQINKNVNKNNKT